MGVSVSYPVAELFASFQGEGVFAGQGALFARLMGCDVKCWFCDQAETWRPDAVKLDGIRHMHGYEIAEALHALVGGDYAKMPERVIVTGGEPTIHDLAPLFHALDDIGLNVHVETAGHRPLPRGAHWVTVAPKLVPKYPGINRDTLLAAHEFKCVVTEPGDMARYDTLFAEHPVFNHLKTPVYYIPEASKVNDGAILAAIAERVGRGGRYRAGVQLHKQFAVR
jgi:organic radical activating enzyme